MTTDSYGHASEGVVVLTFTSKEHDTIRAHARIPMELNMLDQFIGDGNAKLTISMDISDKEYGRGVSVMASLTMTVNQDDESVQMAYHYGSALLKGAISETIPKLNKVYDELKTRVKG